MRVRREKRAIVYLSPCHGCFRASLALGDKAVQAVRQAGLPPRVLKIVNEAKRYAEGTAVRIEVNNRQDIAIVKKLTAIKLKN